MKMLKIGLKTVFAVSLFFWLVGCDERKPTRIKPKYSGLASNDLTEEERAIPTTYEYIDSHGQKWRSRSGYRDGTDHELKRVESDIISTC